MRVKLRKMRETYGFTQYTFADALGISRTHYSQIETGAKNPSLQLAISIKHLLGYKDDDLFENKIPDR